MTPTQQAAATLNEMVDLAAQRGMAVVGGETIIRESGEVICISHVLTAQLRDALAAAAQRSARDDAERIVRALAAAPEPLAIEHRRWYCVLCDEAGPRGMGRQGVIHKSDCLWRRAVALIARLAEGEGAS